MKISLTAGVITAMAIANVMPSAARAGNLANQVFSQDTTRLSAQEHRALAIARQWQQGSDHHVRPFAGRNGAVQFVFGIQQPSVVCAPLQVCDIALEPGEKTTDKVYMGDSGRWKVARASSRTGPNEVQHLIVTPMDVGLTTSLIVTTDRRTYHIRLHSRRTQYMPRVSFVYPEEVLARWNRARQQKQRQIREDTIPATGEYLGNLSFAYDMTGSAPWKPVRVYNDGRKTIIQMPHIMQQTEAPTLLVLHNGGLFEPDKTAIVNYRIQGDRYIVDSVFRRAILISGVGRDQQKITITRRK